MSVGFVDTSNRTVRPVSELGSMVNFGSLENTNPILHPDGTVAQTVAYMQQIVRDHHRDVAKIADKLYDPDLERFLRKVFDLVMTYVKYETDSAFTEQLRTPLRTLKDQKGDCDCMSILIGSILYNKNIPFCFRVSKYDVNRDFSHVYVIVPRPKEGGYYTVDTVIKVFNKEKPVAGKEDYRMENRLNGLHGLSGIPIQMLNGVGLYGGVSSGFYGLYGNLMAVTLGTDLLGFGLGSIEDDETAMYHHLVRTRDVILAAPQMFKIMKNPLEVARMLDFAIRYWDTPNRDSALGILENEEQRLLRQGVIVYPHADLSGGELGELGAGFFKKIGSAIKKGVQKVGTAVKTVAKKVGTGVATAAKAVGKGVATAAKAVGKGVATAAKAVGKGVATAAKAVVNVVARFNPVSLAARGGLLLAIRTNLFKLADKLQYGLYTEAQATAAGMSLDNFRKMQESYNKARNLFVNTLKGKEDKFKQAISKGIKRKAINGLGELGELGAVTATLVTAALGFITSILGFFKGRQDPATGETYTEENATEEQLAAMMNQSGMVDDDGNPILGYNEQTGEPIYPDVNTTAQPEAETFWDKSSNFITNVKEKASNIVSSFLPQPQPYQPQPQPYQPQPQPYYPQSGGSYNPYDGGYSDYEQYETYEEPSQPQPQVQNMTVSPAQGNSSAVTASVMPGGMMSNIGSFIKQNAVMLGVGAVGIGAAIYLMTRKRDSGKGLSGVTRKRKSTKTLKAMKLS
jgi:hypothetical protein